MPRLYPAFVGSHLRKGTVPNFFCTARGVVAVKIGPGDGADAFRTETLPKQNVFDAFFIGRAVQSRSDAHIRAVVEQRGGCLQVRNFQVLAFTAEIGSDGTQFHTEFAHGLQHVFAGHGVVEPVVEVYGGRTQFPTGNGQANR